jgi:hypothetical protein
MDMGVIEGAYNQIKTSLPMTGIFILVTFIAVLMIANRFITDFKIATDGDKPMNIKIFFDLFWNYLAVFIVIVCFPFLITAIEKPLALFQEEIITTYSGYLTMNISEAMKYYEDQYVANEGGFTGADLIPVVKQLYNIYTAFTETIFLFILYMCKYLFYLYSSGRYLYLILLEIVAPLAIVLVLNKDTKQHFYTWVKNLIVCYMMIPTFLLANTLAELIAQNLFPGGSSSMWDINALGPIGLFLTVAFKLYLFGYGQHKLFNVL